MRWIWLLTLTGCFVVTASYLIGNDQPGDPADAKKPDEKKSEPKTASPDEEMLRRADIALEGDALLQFFKKRSLPESERADIERLVRKLGSPDYRVREKASRDLAKRGAAALEVLRLAPLGTTDLETRRRIDGSIERIHDNDAAPGIRAAAVRVLAQRKPAGLVEALLGYLPFADNEAVIEEIRDALIQHALLDGKANPRLLTALTGRSPLRRALAAEAVGRTAYAEHKDALRKLLHDADPFVRYRTARALAFAKDQEAIPALIDALAELPANAAWQAEDFLLRLVGPTPPPPVEAIGNDKGTREKCKIAWHAWWKQHAGKVNLAKVEDEPKLLGRTLIVLLDQNRVLELGPDQEPRWDIKGVNYPLDAQAIGEDHVLIAEYHAQMVTERNSRGEIVWQKQVRGPLVAQRLSNGNTFIATDSQFLEYDKDGQEVDRITTSDDFRKNNLKSMKLPDGDIICMTGDARIVRYGPGGKERSSFEIPLGMKLYGGRIHMLPTGRVLVPHNAEGKVVEYDSRGKAVWEVAFAQPIAATRLPNGNTIITSMDPSVGAVEVDRAGVEVWSYRSTTRVTRAIRR